ncbi:spherulation-specific family 4 protein [Actinoplanes sp. NPDC049265]|uniref:spherulation-specific family 4 protein n=1 Tax=Actinoplanes sp. NPDC049265 TaxID=3363902 RepID=UPI00371E664A
MTALVVPAYFHPAVAADDWKALAAHGSAVRAVILNSYNGPGPAFERELTAAAVATGRPLLGYVDTDYGRRDPDEVLADVDRWHDWYPVTGLFLDRVATGSDLLVWYEVVVEEIRRRTFGTMVFNHGANPDPRYAELADALVTFEGPYAWHQEIEVPAWIRSMPAERIWHLVYDTPSTLLPTSLARAAEANAGVVYVTERAGANPWDGVPGYLDLEVEAWCR